MALSVTVMGEAAQYPRPLPKALPFFWRASMASVPSVTGLKARTAGKGKTGACLLLLHQQFLQPDNDFKKETFPIVVGRDTQE